MENDEKIYTFLQSLVYEDKGGGRIVLVDGARGGGKTGFGCWVIDQYHEKKPRDKYYFVTKADNKPSMPHWVRVVKDITEVPNNSIALIDEGAIQLSSRRHSNRENKEACDRLVVLRHKGITLIILVQNIRMVDINVRRLADIRVLKYGIPFGAEDKEGESDDVKEIRKRLRPRSYKDAYIEIKAHRRFMKFNHDLPVWFDTEKTSKSFKDIDFKKLHGTEERKKEKKSDGKLSEALL